MSDMVDTAFTYGGALLIICLYLQEYFKVKECSLHEIVNANTAFLLSGAELQTYICLNIIKSHNDVGRVQTYTNLDENKIDFIIKLKLYELIELCISTM